MHKLVAYDCRIYSYDATGIMADSFAIHKATSKKTEETQPRAAMLADYFGVPKNYRACRDDGGLVAIYTSSCDGILYYWVGLAKLIMHVVC